MDPKQNIPKKLAFEIDTPISVTKINQQSIITQNINPQPNQNHNQQINYLNSSNKRSEQDVNIALIDQTQSIFWNKYKKIIIIALITILVIGLIVLFVLLFKKSPQSTIHSNTQSDIITQYTNVETYDLVKLNSTSALCLDGTTGGYLLSRTGNSSKVFIYFQFGGWCGDIDYQKTIQSCYQRSSSGFGTMGSATTGTAAFGQGVLSSHQNNYFKDWKKVYLRYCDGSGHQGTRKDPILYKGKLLYFRGHNITVQRFQSLQEKIGLFSNSTQIVVSGESAGGLASFMWSNYIAQRATKAVVRSLPGAGIFYDSFNLDYNDYFFRLAYKNLMNITNQQIDLPVPQCVNAYPSSKQNCFFAQYLHKFVKVPIFAVQSLYDSYSVQYVIGAKCGNMFQTSFSNCNSSQRELIEDYRMNLTNVLVDISKNASNGVWSISCPIHIIIIDTKYYDEFYRIPEYSPNSVNQAVKNWIENTTSSHVYIDTVEWPNNRPCQKYQ